ncbi:uncharacterized protein ASPGLDRAFT_25982 [Aspergillus glaucus CBS 516.65]|uniref:Uncharacterized protein n=1 Tax=Aspergillus glaucus CBS 516.65 TaxID=1160497 RepID=A0A1L9VIN0_ASPGL|nr:hypothetical protein ASPGLDRAFT_25982 [Aspergillus glaucus CBS 516.65]OJJ83779.1 hypothetical protein ASPGLDRAFT_25982 [Aspergillus glaucus CBS 516.65]
MERLKEFASTKLLDSSVDPEGDGAAIIDKLEWNVQGDPALEGCSVNDVRRYQYFVFIKGRRIPALGTWRFQDLIDPTAYIIIIDIQWGDCLDHNDKGNGDG